MTGQQVYVYNKKGKAGEDMKDTGISDYKEKASHGDVLMPIQRYRCIVPFSYQDLSLIRRGYNINKWGKIHKLKKTTYFY